jgi:hypothetical protein
VRFHDLPPKLVHKGGKNGMDSTQSGPRSGLRKIIHLKMHANRMEKKNIGTGAGAWPK